MTDAGCSDQSNAMWRRAVEFERDRWWISPPPWFLTAAITDVRTLLEGSSRSAAGPSFFIKSFDISTVVPTVLGVQGRLRVYSSDELMEVPEGETSSEGLGEEVSYGILREDENF